ncbi:MAG TPA: vWA domain-containing protein [Ktedonobacteraceae bacterium]|nr:vWA domain-containing protein [Ktedonobacteraceae bacterium]
MPEDTYKRSWSRQSRGLLIFLLDQSGSMQQTLQIGGRTYTNGQMATAALNQLIVSVINNTSYDFQTGALKDYCDIFVLGYGDQVTPLLHNGRGLPVSMIELNAHPRGSRPVLVERYDSAQRRNVQVTEMQPYWVDYVADSRYTEMAKALQKACQVIQDWLRAEPKRYHSFPPIVVNITDGEHNGTGDPVEEARRIREIYTNDGHALVFNCHLTSSGLQRLVFPRSVYEINAQITNPDEREWARQLFTMSSMIPRSMVQRARTSYNARLDDGSHGFIYNASPSDLIDFLHWGTKT